MATRPRKASSRSSREPKVRLGWREWVALPDLGIDRIKAKIDTGARTSAIHAEKIKIKRMASGKRKIFFEVIPLQKRKGRKPEAIQCKGYVVDRRAVSDSGGHLEKRWVIETTLQVGKHFWPIELTLASRDSMRFRMLLGRSAVAENCVIYPKRSYIQSKPTLRSGRTSGTRK